jgi:hypothetical protein
MLLWQIYVAANNETYTGPHVSDFCSIFIQLLDTFSKMFLVSNFTKIRPVGAALRQTGGPDEVNWRFSRLRYRVYTLWCTSASSANMAACSGDIQIQQKVVTVCRNTGQGDVTRLVPWLQPRINLTTDWRANHELWFITSYVITIFAKLLSLTIQTVALLHLIITYTFLLINRPLLLSDLKLSLTYITADIQYTLQHKSTIPEKYAVFISTAK